MYPVNPGIRDVKVVTWAKSQPEYLPLESVIAADGRVITKWKLTWKERIKVFIFGTFYHEQLNFEMPLQPVRMHTDKINPNAINHPTAPSRQDLECIKAS